MKNNHQSEETKLLLSSHHRRESYEDETKYNYRQNLIIKQCVSHIYYPFIQLLVHQAKNVANRPNTTPIGSNLSNIAGNTTAASKTKPISEAMSEILSSCFWLNLGKLDCTYALILLQKFTHSLIGVNSLKIRLYSHETI